MDESRCRCILVLDTSIFSTTSSPSAILHQSHEGFPTGRSTGGAAARRRGAALRSNSTTTTSSKGIGATAATPSNTTTACTTIAAAATPTITQTSPASSPQAGPSIVTTAAAAAAAADQDPPSPPPIQVVPPNSRTPTWHQRTSTQDPPSPPPIQVVPPIQDPDVAPAAPPRGGNRSAVCATLLVFGDSTVDPGNNNRLRTTAKANFPPYGVNFYGRRPTRRLSHARVLPPTCWICGGCAADKLGIMRTIPGFLDPTLKLGQLRKGVSFASAGSGYDDITANTLVMRMLGARRFVFVGLPPIGCLPIARTLLGRDPDGCDSDLNQLAASFNSRLIQLSNFVNYQPRLRSAYIDTYTIIRAATDNPQNYGLTEVSRGCCGSGMIEVGQTCRGRRTCLDPSKYLYWDAVHPTETTNQLITSLMLDSIAGIYS
uniref:GDSL esterase/lipase n=1 Tax=Aegilops tauschii TaxID=37682 RepID=R7W343_AEGTA